MSSSDKLRLIRVCFIAPKAYPLFNHNVKEVIGGAEVDLYFLATELAKDKNFTVSFITADYGQEDVETIKDVRVIKSVDFDKNPLTGAAKVWQAMQRADAEIYFQETACWGTFLAAMFCRLHSKMFVYRTANQGECDGTLFGGRCLLYKAYRWSLKKARQVIVQNEIDKENLRDSVSIPSIVIRNGQRLAELGQKIRDTVLWVGRSTHLKRPELFIKLAESTPNEMFAMVCQEATDDENYAALMAQAKEVKNLQFIERVPFSEIDSYFQRAKVFVNTSDSEGFPNTFVQACNCATPILSLKVDPDGFITKHNCGIGCNGNWQRMLDSLKVMLAEKHYVKLGENARKYAEAHHDITKIVEIYKTMFAELHKLGKTTNRH